MLGEDVRQVFDLPPGRMVVCEHRAERRACGCGRETTAGFPAGVSAPTVYGPRLRALAIYLISYQHLPYDRAAKLLADWLGAPLSTGTLHTIIKQAGDGLDRFTALVRAQLIESPVVHVDETGGRAEGRVRWVHSASTETLTLYRLHDRRGIDGIDHLGVLPAFSGTAVHDGWLPYRSYQAVTHALCNVHHLRELQGATERDPNTQTWAAEMDRLLRDLNREVEHARSKNRTVLSHRTLTAFSSRYDQTIRLGHAQNPPPERTGKRGPLARSKTANLHRRLDLDRDQVLRFANDFQVPFHNNLAERDIRMIKLQQKISGCWRTTDGAERFLAIRSYLSTARKQHQPLLETIARLVDHQPWLPQTAIPNPSPT